MTHPPESAPVIQVDGLSKEFRRRFRRGSVQAVRNVSLEVERGSVVAFVGPNGAGKTTTIYALLGLLRPDRGSVRLFGEPAGSPAALRRIGFQSEIFYTYGFKTAHQALRFYGDLSAMPGEQLEAAIPSQLSRLGLAAASDRKVNGFSKGMTQRLGLAQALLHNPELLILDEPTTGLDPEGRKLVADIISAEKARGTTVFLSSHILADIERTCDHVIIISQGSIAFSASMDTVRSEADGWEIEVANWGVNGAEAFGALDIRTDGAHGAVVRCGSAERNNILRALLADSVDVGAVRALRSLEDLYMKYAGGSSSG